ncbi:oligosaccharide flippase family protein [Carboxylicivirga sp. N1Y90]|uniref:oligosaccharide flippase family protein n=1 Tax=Carboxylicivirga fragile TaxID=3417571 RepID=UPI003D347305
MLKNIRTLLKDFFFYGIGNSAAKASGIILLPLYLEYISTEEFGLLALYETVFVVMLTITSVGTKSGLARWYNDVNNPDEKKALFFSVMTFNVFSSFLGIICISIILYNSSLFNSLNSSLVIVWFCLSSLFKLLFDVPTVLLRLQQKSKTITNIQIINIIITLCLTYYFLGVLNDGFIGIFKAQAIANAISFLIVLPIIIKNSIWSLKLKMLVELIQYGYPLAISNVLTTGLTLSDRYFIEHYQSLTDVGSYSMAYKISNLLQFIVVASFITSYTYNYYKSMNDKGSKAFLVTSFNYFIFLMTILGLGIIFFSREAIYILSSGDATFYDAIPVIPVLILGLIFSGIRQVFVLPITKAKKTKIISLVMVLTGLINIGLNFIVIPYYGKVGAALTTLISQLFAVIWFLIALDKLKANIYNVRKIALALFVGMVYCVLFFFIPLINIYIDVLIKISLLFMCVLTLYVLGFFERDELEKMLQAWHKWKNISQLKSNISQLKK